MDGGSRYDGRLDLDDLGEIIDVAGRVGDGARAEVLDDGRGRTWGNRLEAAGVTPWLRRHRLAVAGTAAVVGLVGAGAAAYVLWAPPPFDPEMRVMVTQLPPAPDLLAVDTPGTATSTAGGGIVDVDGHARAAYSLTPSDPADTSTYSILAITGPAVRASSTHDYATYSTATTFASNVDAILDCTDPAGLDPAVGSYSLQVSRTDEWGRTLIASVPDSDDPAGWPMYVSSWCAPEQTAGALELRGVSVRPGPRVATVSLDLDVANTLPLDVVVSAPEEGGYPQVSTRLPEIDVVAGGTARLPLVLQVHDCTAPALLPIAVVDPHDPGQDIARTEPGRFLVVETKTQLSRSGEIPRPRGGSPVHWPSSTAREIDSALRASCAGAPRTRPTVRLVEAGPSGAVVESFPTGNGSADRAAFVVLSVATSGRRVTVLNPTLTAPSYTGSYLSQSTARLLAGRATLTTTWSYDCSGGGYAPPPTIEVRVTTPAGDFPFQQQLNSAQLSRAILDVCVTADEQQLVDSGWAAPTPGRRLPAIGQ